MSDCVFCQIAAGTIPADVVARTPEAVAFRDLNPQAPHHILVIPIRHLAAVRDGEGAEDRALLGHLLQFAAEVAAGLGLDAGGYRIVTNTGAGAGQSVFHLHLHLLGGRAFSWPPG